MEDDKKVFSTQIVIEVDVEVVKTSFWGWHGSLHGGHHQMKVNFMEVDKETLEEEEVIKVVVEVIKVNNQIAIQIPTTMGNLGTWQKIIIK